MKTIKSIIALFIVFIISHCCVLSYGEALRDCPQKSSTFSFSVSEEIKKHKAKNKNDLQQAENEYKCRLIGKTTDLNINFSSFKPNKKLICEDGRFYLSFSSESDAKNCKKTLEEDCRILYVCSDAIIYSNDVTEGEANHISYGPELLRTDWYCNENNSKELKQTIVSVIDSGAAEIDYLKCHLTQGYDFVDNDSDTSNDLHPNSHGTFLASEIIDCFGSFPIKVMPVRVLSSTSGSLINIINGIYFAVDNGADVINISLGGKLDNCEAVEDSINYALENNVAVVVCSGNEHNNTRKYCPAHINDVITVSAVDNENVFASSFSNYGETVDFSSPGVDIVGYNAKGNLKTLSGTSMSTAFVSAAVAMIKSTCPDLNNKQLYEYLKLLSEDHGEEGWDPYYGWGTINLQNASFINQKWATGVNISNHELSLAIGEQTKLTETVFPFDASNRNVKWESTDNSIVTVNSEGIVIANNPGTAEIIVSTMDGEYSDKCKVTVHPHTPYLIFVTKLPDKTSYQFGEDLVLDGMVVEAYYEGGAKEDIVLDDLCVIGFSSKTIGSQIVYITYLGCEASFEVQVYRTWWQTVIWFLTFQWLKDLLH